MRIQGSKTYSFTQTPYQDIVKKDKYGKYFIPYFSEDVEEIEKILHEERSKLKKNALCENFCKKKLSPYQKWESFIEQVIKQRSSLRGESKI